MPVRPMHRILGVASGFKLFLLWHRLGGDVIYFDHNQRSLDIWQDIVTNWSGRDFPTFCHSKGYEDDFDKMALVIAAIGDEDRFQDRWRQFQSTAPRFMRCDLLTDPEQLVEQMADCGNCVWYSNCFKYFEGIRRYGLAGTTAREATFRSLILRKAPDTLLLNAPVMAMHEWRSAQPAPWECAMGGI
jgi:hypothetical protein